MSGPDATLFPIEGLLSQFDPATGLITGVQPTIRRLSDLRDCFFDPAAYEATLAKGNPVIYQVCSVEPGHSAGDLHYGIGCVMPGKIGSEYFLTKGHLHSWRPAAEFYFGLTGEGLMLLEDEATGESRTVPLRANGAVYVPGHTAHRTINVGTAPLTYLGIYPANAGHDYAAIARRNFRKIVVDQDGAPALRDR